MEAVNWRCPGCGAFTTVADAKSFHRCRAQRKEPELVKILGAIARRIARPGPWIKASEEEVNYYYEEIAEAVLLAIPTLQEGKDVHVVFADLLEAHGHKSAAKFLRSRAKVMEK